MGRKTPSTEPATTGTTPAGMHTFPGRLIGLDVLTPSPTNPRRHINDGDMAELIESVRVHGVMNPILVRQLPTLTYEIVTGERRWRAAKAAGHETIPAIVRELTDQEVLEIQVIENLQRSDIHPLDEAAAYKAMLQYHTPLIIAGQVGKSISYVTRRLKLLELTPDAQKQFLEGKFTVAHAFELARLTPEVQGKLLNAMHETVYQAGFSGNGKQARVPMALERMQRWIKDNVLLNLSEASFPKTEDGLLKGVGPCSTCPKRTGSDRDLFGDMGPGDRCLDPKCFNAKGTAFLKRQLALAEKKFGRSIVHISGEEHRWNSPKRLPTRDVWKRAGKTDADAVPAVIVEGPGLGQILQVILPEDAKPAPSSSNRETQKAEQRDSKIRDLVKKFTEEALLEKVPDTFSDDTIRLLAGVVTNGWAHGEVAQLAGVRDHSKLNTAKLPAPTLIRIILTQEIVLGGDVDDINAACKLWGVDVAALRKRAAAEVDPALKPKAKGKKT